MSDRYFIPAESTVAEVEVKRSRFRATVGPAPDVDAAKAFIQQIRDADPDATHHCWAYLVGPPGSSDRVGMSDDGEPHGTAGRPMLHVLSHSDLGDVVAVVTRWYGGTKLGAGGLVRAYSDATREAIDAVPREEKVDRMTTTLTIPYALIDPLRRMLGDHEAEILDEVYTDAVELSVQLPRTNHDAFVSHVGDLSNGTARFTP